MLTPYNHKNAEYANQADQIVQRGQVCVDYMMRKQKAADDQDLTLRHKYTALL